VFERRGADLRGGPAGEAGAELRRDGAPDGPGFPLALQQQHRRDRPGQLCLQQNKVKLLRFISGADVSCIFPKEISGKTPQKIYPKKMLGKNGIFRRKSFEKLFFQEIPRNFPRKVIFRWTSELPTVKIVDIRIANN
jgi:hypothetical protein